MNTSTDIDPENPGGDDFYDADGNVDQNGLYDAGGHLVPLRYADFADYEIHRFKDTN